MLLTDKALDDPHLVLLFVAKDIQLWCYEPLSWLLLLVVDGELVHSIDLLHLLTVADQAALEQTGLGLSSKNKFCRWLGCWKRC
jgi:hypothetical protein